MASLFVIRGKDAGRHFPLIGERIILGRDPQCQVPVIDTEVSRQHAAIVMEDNQSVLVDLSSSNGTFVNERRIDRHLLKSGDRLQLGRSLLVFTSRESDMTPSTASGIAVDIVSMPSSTPGSDELSQIRRTLPTIDASPNPSMHSFAFGSASSVDRKTAASQSPSEPTAAEPPTSHWEIMYRTVLAVSRTMDIDQLLQQILDFIFQGVGCDRGCILLSEEDPPRMRPVVYRNRKGNQSQPRIEISQTILDYVMKNREGVLTGNAGEDQRWQAGISIVGMGIREAICVPMLGRYGLVGAIYIDTSQTPGELVERQGKLRLDEDQLKLMIAVGHQAALAVEDTFYYRAMVQSERLAAMGQTIATLSHHVKNILQGINGGSYLVQEGIKREQIDTIAKGWRIVEKNQERISSLVMDMLTFSKDRSPERKVVDIVQIVEDCLELTEPRANELGIQLNWHRPHDFPSLSAEPEAIHRAVLNVLGNAVDALAETDNGKIEVGLRVENQKAYIDIIDNGPGIAAEELPRIFSLFESTKGIRGTGLGLPVSQKILREHGGEIEVTSHPGTGSRFSLVLPINLLDSPTGDTIDRPA